jgi:hypothetical protein
LPNSIADLTRREARFLHNVTGATDGSTFPYGFVDYQAIVAPDGLIFETAQRQGDDVVLTNVLAFDVRVFDPAAPVVDVGATAVVPGDPGFIISGTAWGAYVDLGHGITTSGTLAGKTMAPLFSGAGIGALAGNRTYDTWSTHYEANGRDEDGDSIVDDGINGIDDNNNGTIDDASERETSPPYPVPLRGIEVRIRCYEPASRQVRQVTVRHTFVPH